VYILDSILTGDQMLMWGWRLPFLISIFPGLVSLWGRHGLTETTEFLKWQTQCQHTQSSASENMNNGVVARLRYGVRLCRTHRHAFGVLFFGTALGAAAFYQSIWCISYARGLGLSSDAALGAGVLQQVVIVVTVPIVAYLSDKMDVGPHPALLFGNVLFTCCAVPLFAVIKSNAADASIAVPCIALGYGVLLGLVFGTYHILFVDLFPTHVRATAFGFVFNSSFAIFGGFVAVISQALVEVTPLGPAYYTVAIGLLSIGVLLRLRGMLRLGVVELQHFAVSKSAEDTDHKSDAVQASV